MDIRNPLIFSLLINSILPIILILNQNDNTKEIDKNGSSINQSNTNPLEFLTWITLIVQFFLLLIRTKITDY
jgi:hypothetical protein